MFIALFALQVRAAEDSTNNLARFIPTPNEVDVESFEFVELNELREKYSPSYLDLATKELGLAPGLPKRITLRDDFFGINSLESVRFHYVSAISQIVPRSPKFTYPEPSEESALNEIVPSCQPITHATPFINSSGKIESSVVTSCQDLLGESYYWTVRVELFHEGKSRGVPTEKEKDGKTVSFSRVETLVEAECSEGKWESHGLIVVSDVSDAEERRGVYNNTLQIDIENCDKVPETSPPNWEEETPSEDE